VSTDTKKSRKPRAEAEPDFLSAPELARRLGVGNTVTLDRWIASGRFPPPWAWLGPRRRLWRRSDYEHFVRTGEWPREAWKGG
jgi:predicted DNA-binding transcriptional regulator AlpA